MIYEDLRKRISEGDFVAGDLLPSENVLSGDFGATRPTVRKALDLLIAEGVIIRKQGKGSIIKGVPKAIGILSLQGTTSAVADSTMRTEIVVSPEIRPWNEAMNFELTPREKDAGCIYFERLRVINGQPVILDITMLPNIGLPRFMENNLENASLFSLLRTKYGVTVTGGVQYFFAIGADKRLRSFLNVKPGHPVLQLNRRIETSRKGFHIYSQIFCETGSYTLSGTF
ncbi:MAG: GntR family transcriptional regulator [Alistipes sp.]|nr:GntR family transcriptional regulator [Alistipes sp.]